MSVEYKKDRYILVYKTTKQRKDTKYVTTINHLKKIIQQKDNPKEDNPKKDNPKTKHNHYLSQGGTLHEGMVELAFDKTFRKSAI